MRRLIVRTSPIALILFAGCGLNLLPGKPPAAAPFGAPLTIDACQRAYRNDAYGVGFNPPADATGPAVEPGTGAHEQLLTVSWRTPTGRTYRLSVVNIGTLSFDAVIQNARTIGYFRGLQVLDDRPVSFDSGRTGWLLMTGSPGGATETVVFDARRGYLFGVGVDTSGATSAESDAINATLASLCVDP